MKMVEKSLVSIKVAPGQMEMRELDIPEIHDDGALMRVEVAGV
jgi:hypothetical protein